MMLAAATRNFIVVASEVVNCTSANVDQRGTIVFTKGPYSPKRGDQVFGFVFLRGRHAIVEGQNSGECTVPAGTYDVVEEGPGSSFALGSIEVNDDDSSGDVAQRRTATYVLGPGEVVEKRVRQRRPARHDRVHEGRLAQRHRRQGLRLRLALR